MTRRRSSPTSKLLFSTLLPFSLLICSCGSPSSAIDAQPVQINQLTPEEASEGWILLFDGETLDGWEDPAKENPPGDAWIVEDGCIKTVPRPRIREDLLTLERFRDFEFTFEWKISQRGNSGVKYLVQDRVVLIDGKPDPSAERFEDRVHYEMEYRLGNRNAVEPDDRVEEYLVAFEYQIIDNLSHPDAGAAHNRTTASIYGLVAPQNPTLRPVGEFNQSRIVLEGNRVRHWLNGDLVLDVDLTSEEIKAGLEKRWTQESPIYRLLTELPRRESPIALQHHNDEVWFRNLKIRRLN
ncbi:MAG TPA: DUF1080 domain-containing protein [Acidobacteriota bacterium]|nr:DUF1080 domain-containing protein [Acidobacteriota bacterium]